jgi:hypothetical protein
LIVVTVNGTKKSPASERKLGSLKKKIFKGPTTSDTAGGSIMMDKKS